MLFAVVEVSLGFETKGCNALSVVDLGSLILGEDATSVLLVHVDGDEHLPLRLVLGDSAILRSSETCFPVAGLY